MRRVKSQNPVVYSNFFELDNFLKVIHWILKINFQEQNGWWHFKIANGILISTVQKCSIQNKFQSLKILCENCHNLSFAVLLNWSIPIKGWNTRPNKLSLCFIMVLASLPSLFSTPGSLFQPGWQSTTNYCRPLGLFFCPVA